MKRTEGQSRINSLSVVKMEMVPSGVTDEQSMSVTVALMDERSGPGILAKSGHNGPWPTDIQALMDQLRDRVEEHLLSIYFEVNDDRAKHSPSHRPSGIVEPELGRSTTDTPQL